MLQRDKWWPKMAADVEHYIGMSPNCQRNKSSNQRPAGLMKPLDIPTVQVAKTQSVSLDLIVQLLRLGKAMMQLQYS